MAEADKNTTTPSFLKLPQAAELIGREALKELQFALEDGRLLARDRANWAYFEESAHFLIGYAPAYVPQSDLDAVRAISRGHPIPPPSWRRWFWDGVVNFETGEIKRPFFDREVVFQPELWSKDVLGLVPPVIDDQVGAEQENPFKRWLVTKVGKLEREGKIPNKITDFSKHLEQLLIDDAKRDSSLSKKSRRHIENMLRDWGLFSKKRTK
jgi:hypothetical protein